MNSMKKSHATSGKTQVVFVRLDPLLQKLLNLVTQYREFVDNNNGEDDGMRLVESIKSLLEVLDELYEAIKQFGTTFSASLIVLADYVSLPLTSIFHINLEPTTAFDKETESEGSIRRQQIRRSYMHKLYLSTAKTIQCYVHACKEKQDSSTDEDPKDNQLHIPVTLNNKHLIQFLIALTNALPSDVEPGGKINTTHTNYLDDGSELCIVLLRTIETIVGVFKKDDNNLSDVWDGNLLARIVDCTASLSNNTPKQDLSLQCLQTLQTLLDATSSKLALWQSMFPGVFSSLYRRVISLHRQTSAGLSVSIECHALDILTELFRVTLSSLGTIHTSKKVKSATALLHQLESISRNQQRTVRGEMTPEEDSSTSFLGQVKKRVVAPLCLLLRQEAISPSEKVRMHVVSLCRVLLVDTRECWKGTNIQELSLEVCLIVEASPEVSARLHAASAIQEFQDHSDGMDLSWIVSRILSLMEELPVLAQGSKKVEVRMQLQLLTGYLRAAGTKASPAIAASVAMRRSLIQLMDIDFDGSSSTRVLATPTDIHQASDLQFRWLDSETALLSKNMLVVLGRILGVKHGALIVDAFISDFCEEGMDRVSSFGASHIEWLHNWIGSLVVAKEIFVGAFSVKKGANTDSKHERRRKRVLQSLSSSLLPLLINSSLWNLPTLFRAKDDDRHLLSPLSLYANACVSVLLLEFLSPSCEFLKQDIGKYILTLLYPIVEKACLRNIPMIQRSALHVISVIANACGFSDFSAFLRQEFNTLMACMSGRLRLPGGPQLQGDLDLENTVAVLSSSRWVLENAIRNIQDVTSWSDRASTSSMINLMSLLVDRFDHLFLRKLVSEKDFIEITLVYKSTFAYFLTIFGSSNDTVYSYRTKNPEDRSRLEWLDTLTFFRKSSMGDFCKINQEERNSDTEASVRKKASDKTLDVSMTEIDFASKLITRSSYFLSHESLGVRISACDSLTSGFRFLAFVACEYEDSNDEQNTIRNSILRQVASSWPSTKARLLTVSEEIIESTLSNKEKRLNSFLIARPLDVPRPSPTQDVSTQRIFMAKVFILIATMCECSGDFMADRFKNDVWPVISRHLGNLITKQESKDRLLEKQFDRKLKIQDLEDAVRARSSTSYWSDSERLLILSILKCLVRVFQHKDCGFALSGILASAGSMLLPFLDNNDHEVVRFAMQALKNIITIDCDVIWRPLVHLSGRGMPRCPLANICHISNKVLSNKVAPQVSLSEENDSDLSLRCQELIDFIKSLPEQPL